MNGSNTKRLGVFISHIFGRYQTNLCQGIIDQAKEYGYSVDIFVSADGEDFGSYGLGEQSILRIPVFQDFSGIVFASGTYLLPELRSKILESLCQHCHCPIIDVNSNSENFPVISLDNNSPIAQLVEHLILTHHCRRICFLGNCLEQQFSKLRLSLYQKTMEKHLLSVTETDITEADYTEASIQAAIEYFLQASLPPDAIVCYNDAMALLAMKVLCSKGFRIPEDIRLTGCDELETGQSITPSLTTVTFPLYEIGKTAVHLLMDARKNVQIPLYSSLTAEPVYRGSCGCQNQNIAPALHTYELIEQIQSLEATMLNNVKLSAQLQKVTDIQEGMDLIEKYVADIRGLKELYLCLYPDWERIPQHYPSLITGLIAHDTFFEPPASGARLLKFAFKDGKRLPECSFCNTTVLPDYIYRTLGTAYIFTPLYFGYQAFGYAAVSYEKNQLAYHLNFLTWLTTVSRMFKSICDDRHMTLLAAELETACTKDHITGFYNLEGLKLTAAALVSEAAEARKPLFLAVFELEQYQAINRQFGHAEGNFALQVVGHAIENAQPIDMICSHPGGELFYLLADGMTEESALALQQKVRSYLEHYNRLHTRPYLIAVHFTYQFLTVTVETSLNDLFDAALIMKNND